MTDQTTELNLDIVISVRRRRVVDRMAARRVFDLLQPVFGYDADSTQNLLNFVTLNFGTNSIEGADFDLIHDEYALFDVWEAAYEKYLNLPVDFVDQWVNLYNQVNSAPSIDVVKVYRDDSEAKD